MEVTLKNVFLNNKDTLEYRLSTLVIWEPSNLSSFLLFSHLFLKYLLSTCHVLGSVPATGNEDEQVLIYNLRIYKTYRNVNSCLQDNCTCFTTEKKHMTVWWPKGSDSWLEKAREDFKGEVVLHYLTTDRNAMWWHPGIQCLNSVLHVLCLTVLKDLILCTTYVRI